MVWRDGSISSPLRVKLFASDAFRPIDLNERETITYLHCFSFSLQFFLQTSQLDVYKQIYTISF